MFINLKDSEPIMLNKPKTILLILAAVFLVLIILACFAFWRLQALKKDPRLKETSAKTAQEETKALINKIGQLLVLPEGEEPVIATVTDPEQLKDQVFFTKAKRGDKVLIYTNAKKAILYDPVANKILEVAPLNLGVAPPVSSSTPETTPKVK
jgi:hypothetical protein